MIWLIWLFKALLASSDTLVVVVKALVDVREALKEMATSGAKHCRRAIKRGRDHYRKRYNARPRR